eukprot:5612103-Amphidinium_carterae.1
MHKIERYKNQRQMKVPQLPASATGQLKSMLCQGMRCGRRPCLNFPELNRGVLELADQHVEHRQRDSESLHTSHVHTAMQPRSSVAQFFASVPL